METICPKKQKQFSCEFCNYYTSYLKDYNKHILTKKHKSVSAETCFQNPETQKSFICDICQRDYLSRAGLWKHKQKCNTHLVNETKQTNLSDKDLIIMLINDNKELRNLLVEQSREKDEFKNMMMKVIENGTHNTTNTTTNSHNKAFNLQFFLNETCKNAMNITDFVDSIKLQLSDLERVGELGYVKGISDIITNNLKAMDVTLRPIHCTDKKRETMYIRDNNEWKKEEDNKPHLRNAIKKIEENNRRLIPQYRTKYPDYNDSSSKRVDKYDKIVLESLGGIEEEKIEKVIRIISNVTTIDK